MWVDPLNHDHAANPCLCMRVCGHLSVYMCTSVYLSVCCVCMRVCGHLSVCMCTSVYLSVLCVYACVWTSDCVYVHKCVSVCCVYMRVRGHLCV